MKSISELKEQMEQNNIEEMEKLQNDLIDSFQKNFSLLKEINNAYKNFEKILKEHNQKEELEDTDDNRYIQ